MLHDRSSTHGMSLVELLIVLGIMSVVLMAMGSVFQGQTRETQALSEKLAALDFQRTVSGAISVPLACGNIVNVANLVPGETLTFNPATRITSTDKNNPSIIAKLKKVYAADGTAVLADSTATPNPAVSPLSNNLKLRPGAGVRLAGYRDVSSGQIVYQLLLGFDQNALVRPIHDLPLTINVTTVPVGPNVQVTGCVGSAAAPPSVEAGTICGNRLVFCHWPPGNLAYDNEGGVWSSPNIPCNGTTLTAACTPTIGPNLFIIGVNGCPTGYTGSHAQIGCTNASAVPGDPPYSCTGGTMMEIGYIFCRKN